MNKKIVPHNTGKILIGVRYDAPQQAPEFDADAELLQRALLSKREGQKALVKFITNSKENAND
jgi:hypothetical protein